MIPICLGSLWDGDYTALRYMRIQHVAADLLWGIIRFIDSFLSTNFPIDILITYRSPLRGVLPKGHPCLSSLHPPRACHPATS